MAAIPIREVIERLLHRGRSRFIVDTCFLLNPDGLRSLDEFIWNELHARKCPMVLPYAVLRELDRHMTNKTDSLLAESSRKIVEILKRKGDLGHIRMLGTNTESFADQTLLEVFTRFRVKYDLVLFSNDTGLARDLLRLNETESTRTRNEIWVAWTFQGDVYAANRLMDLKRAPQSRRHPRAPSVPRGPSREAMLFPPENTPRPVDETRVGGSALIQKGTTLRTESGRPIILGESLAAGGEGEIFRLDGAQVAKIYFPDKRTAYRSDKLRLMCSRPAGVVNVSWPTERLFDSDRRFVGFLMPSASGKPLQLSVVGKRCLEDSFPRWDRRDLVSLATSVASTVGQLNDLGVIVGDINPMNFLIREDGTLSLVDADSMQVGDFPCLVGMNNFRAPEIECDSYKDILRTDQHERFALATLLFMILMAGKPPFSFQGGGDPVENIRQRNFPYVTNQQQIPAGAYRYIWSHFPEQIKRAFARAFVGLSPTQRPSPNEWVETLGRYSKELANPDSPEALLIWPTSFKPRKGSRSVQLRCAQCNTSFQTSPQDAERRRQYSEVLCHTCVTILTMARQAGQNHTCKHCGKLFQVPFHIVQRHSNVVPVCNPCLERIAAARRTCRGCNSLFALDYGEVRFHLAKGLHLPSRCKACRGKKQPQSPTGRSPAPASRTSKTSSTRRPPPAHPPQVPQKTLWDTLRSFFE